MTRPVRIRVDIHATLIAADGWTTGVIIRDMSADGFRLEHHDDLRSGDQVRLVLNGEETVPATIMWSIGSEAGGKFIEPPAARLG